MHGEHVNYSSPLADLFIFFSIDVSHREDCLKVMPCASLQMKEGLMLINSMLPNLDLDVLSVQQLLDVPVHMLSFQVKHKQTSNETQQMSNKIQGRF